MMVCLSMCVCRTESEKDRQSDSMYVHISVIVDFFNQTGLMDYVIMF